MESTRIVDEFRRYFAIVPAVDEALRCQAYRIRYAVYAEELGWEDRNRFKDGLETDEHDRNAVICLLRHRETGLYVGCVRLILGHAGPEAIFPFEQALKNVGQPFEFAADSPDWRTTAGEISRVAVISQFRRRRNEQQHPDNPPDDEPTASPERRVFPHIAMGLYLGAAAMGLQRGLSRVFAIMEPKLARRLRTYGIEFEAVGEPLEHHGLRVPYRLERSNLERNMAPPIRALLEQITADLSA